MKKLAFAIPLLTAIVSNIIKADAVRIGKANALGLPYSGKVWQGESLAN